GGTTSRGACRFWREYGPGRFSKRRAPLLPPPPPAPPAVIPGADDDVVVLALVILLQRGIGLHRAVEILLVEPARDVQRRHGGFFQGMRRPPRFPEIVE